MSCQDCQRHCCGRSTVGPPILMPGEADFWRGFTTPIEGTTLQRLLRKEDGTCYYLQGKNHCSVYPYRPTECRLYPWILTWKEGKLDVEINFTCPEWQRFPKPTIPQAARKAPISFWIEFEQQPI